MKFIELKQKLSDFVVFSTRDIKNVEPDFYVSRLGEWQKKGYIRQIIKGYYIFGDVDVDERVLYIIANKIYPHSYVSLESALHHYNIIPEGVFTVTSVSTRRTYTFDTELGTFSYKNIKPALMFGYVLGHYKGVAYKIASIEKTLLDFFYLNSRIKDVDDIEGLRFNYYELQELLDKDKLNIYLSLYKRPSLEKKVALLLNLVDNA